MLFTIPNYYFFKYTMRSRFGIYIIFILLYAPDTIILQLKDCSSFAPKSFAAGAPPRTPLGELTTLPQIPKSE
jgi:hypothetical protein